MDEAPTQQAPNGERTEFLISTINNRVTSGYFGASKDNFMTTLPIQIRYPFRTPNKTF